MSKTQMPPNPGGRPMRIGSLFSGYSGLDMGVSQVLDAETAWFCEFDANPSKILAHHYPDVPNLGDITTADFTAVEPVDVIAGGFPCQDVSHAGRRKGLIRDGEGRTRSGLWGHMLRAIDSIRPSLVVAENVRGLLSATADSDVEPCPFCMGADGGSPMRALGAVLADLADIGYDAAWTGLPASGVGAPHGRFRVFILAWPATDTHDGVHRIVSGGMAGTTTSGQRGDEGTGRGSTDRRGGDPAALSLLPTPRAGDGEKGGPNQRGSSGDYMLPSAVVNLLPTPAVNDMGAGKTPEAWDEWTDRMKSAHGNGNGHGASLSIEALRMLPTPRAGDGEKGGPNQRGSSGDLMLPSAVMLMPTPTAQAAKHNADDRGPGTLDDFNLWSVVNRPEFGDYAPAIHRWEQTLGRPAPAPTEPTGKQGAHRLSPAFVEWMMGLPAGWVTDTPGLGRNAQLKALGNGVVPQQAAAAARHLLGIHAQERAA